LEIRLGFGLNRSYDALHSGVDGQTCGEKEQSMSNNPVVYWELASHDATRTVDFLKKVFDWDFEYDARTAIHELPAELMPVQGGGVFTLRRARLPFVTIYIKVDDLDAKVKLIEENGGFIVDPPLDLPDGSRICLFNEPSGVTLAMIQSAQK
jgi:predicted enzyme related to lactoylglutathione lyase